MTSHEFLSCLRALTMIEPQDVPNIEDVRWRAFRASPFSFLLNAGQIEEAEIWRAVESRVLTVRQDNSKVTEGEQWR